MTEETNVGIRVSCKLIADIKQLLNLSAEMPANFAVDTALRELRERLKQEKKGASA